MKTPSRRTGARQAAGRTKRGASRAGRLREAPPPGFYLDASALAKLYLQEPESEDLNRRLLGYRQTLISDLGITEVVSACARRRREGALDANAVIRVHRAILNALNSAVFIRLTLDLLIHRKAEVSSCWILSPCGPRMRSTWPLRPRRVPTRS